MTRIERELLARNPSAMVEDIKREVAFVRALPPLAPKLLRQAPRTKRTRGLREGHVIRSFMLDEEVSKLISRVSKTRAQGDSAYLRDVVLTCVTVHGHEDTVKAMHRVMTRFGLQHEAQAISVAIRWLDMFARSNGIKELEV